MSRRTLGAFLCAALLNACANQAQVVPERQAPQAADTVCRQTRSGQPTCLTLVLAAQVRPNVSGLTPADFQARYKLPSKSKGKGQIVAIVDAYDNPNVASDLAAYRKQFGLGAAKFTKFNEYGRMKNYPSGSPGWGVEIDVDTEMVSATCPKCTIYLIEANSANGSDLETAEDTAVTLGAHIVSNSWICYGSLNCVNQSHFDTPGIIYLAASGDQRYGQGGAPMAFSSVAAIGGTVLTKSGSQYTEQVWSGGGGGCLTGVKRPRWQHDKFCAYRAANDASAVASNVAAYDTYGSFTGWLTVAGTSISAPLLAGVFGLAGNAQQQKGGRTFWEKAHHHFLYDVCSPSCLFERYSYSGGWGSPDGIGAF
ncbi:MAG: peptidase S8 [Candidatus Eremiobacteraeota bacterium]|nr:peptidase S8 [Candidatus Eremiobacteraeota bacterium]